jgi:tripartite-type tricarboxylate transporter receptor subunit TctC
MKLPWPALLFCALVCAATEAGAQGDVTAFYRGKQLRMIVGSAVGGGYDLFARIVARHLVNHIPGSPHIVVQNLPAAGGVTMTNQLYNQGPKDGTVIGVPINGIPTAPLLQSGTQFDQTRLTWIGSTNREAYVAFVWHSVPVRSITELTSKEVVVGATTPGTTMVDFPQLVNDVLGFKFKIVRGYQGTPQINLAIERGEVQGMGGLGWASVKAQTPHWISERKIRVLAQYGFKRHAELKDVPTMLEFARTEADRQAMTMLFARTEYGRPYFLPPDVPMERVAALRRAFDATMIDPAFIADANRLQFDVDPLTGEQVQALVAELAATPREVVASGHEFSWHPVEFALRRPSMSRRSMLPGHNGGDDHENSIRRTYGETAPARECGRHRGHATRRGGYRRLGHVDAIDDQRGGGRGPVRIRDHAQERHQPSGPR